MAFVLTPSLPLTRRCRLMLSRRSGGAGGRSEGCWAEKAAGGMPMTRFYSPGPLPVPRHGVLCSRAF